MHSGQRVRGASVSAPSPLPLSPLIALLVALTGLVGTPSCASREAPEPLPDEITLTFLSDFNIPHGSRFESLGDEAFGGVSALAYDPERQRWLGLSDARVNSRYYVLDMQRTGDAFSLVPEAAVFFTRDGGSFAENELDPEGVVVSPWRTLLVSSEADTREHPVHQAQLLEFALDGALRQTVSLPAKFLVEGWPPATGTRHNLGFESLTRSPSGALFAATEQTLLQDGPEAAFDRAGFCRIVRFDRASDNYVAGIEYVYPLGPVPGVEGTDVSDVDVGLVELVALTDTRFLSLERDYLRVGSDVPGINRIRIYVVDVDAATDVRRIDDLQANATWQPVQKQLLYDFDDLVSQLSPEYPTLDNFEAMGLGPELPDGGRLLLVASDDNFRSTQRSAFLLFRLEVRGL